MRHAAIALSLLIIAGCSSKLIVRPVTPGSATAAHEGVYYALPKTVLAVDVPVVRTRTLLGEFNELVTVFFPFDDPPAEDVSFTLGEPTLGAFGVPDESRVYLAIVKGGRFEDKKLLLNFGEDGTIDKIEAESNNRALEFAGQVVKSAAALAAKFLSVAPLASPAVDEALAPPPPFSDPDCLAIEAFLGGPANALAAAVKDECHSVGAPFRRPMRAYIQGGHKPDQPDARARTFIRAYDAASRLRHLRSKRDQILDAQTVAGASGDPLRSALDEIEREIASIVAKFFGTEEEKLYWTASYQITPDAFFVAYPGVVQSVTLFRYSPTDGVCQASSEPVPGVSVQEMLPPPARSVTCPKEVALELDISRPASQYADTVTGSGPGSAGDRGLFYRIPAKARVVLHVKRITAGGTLRSGRLQYSPSLAQFGVVVSLPATTGGRRTQYAADFYSATGAMKSFRLDSEAQIDKTVVGDIETAGSSLLDARAARLEAERKDREARAQAADELNRLKREAEMLETQLRIKEAQGKLGPPADAPEN